MSNEVRNLVKMTYVKGLAVNAVLNHIADVVRDANHRFFQGQRTVALALGTDRKCVRRQLQELQKRGLISRVGERPGRGSPVDEYVINLDAVMALPAIDDGVRRDELYAKLLEKGWGSEPQGEVLTAPPGGVESPTRHTYPCFTRSLAEKTRISDEEKSAREQIPDHLKGNDDFAAWEAAKQAAARDAVPMPGFSDSGEDRPPPYERTLPKKTRGTG